MPVFLLCIILFILLLKFKLQKNEKEEQKELEEYLAKEAKASLPIKRSLQDLEYIQIPLEQLPFHPETHKKLSKLEQTIKNLSQENICDFRGISNTDLKLKYGAGNLNELSEYELNYTLLIRTLADWASLLLELGFDEDALTVSNYAIRCGSDISKTYTTLARIYKKQDRLEDLYGLIPIAEERSSTMDLKKAIYDVLNEY